MSVQVASPAHQILIGDPDHLRRTEFAAFLTGAGFEVTHVAHALEVRGQLALDHFDVVMLDEAIDDFAELVSHIRAVTPSPLMIALVDTDNAPAIDAAYQTSINQILLKPISLPFVQVSLPRWISQHNALMQGLAGNLKSLFERLPLAAAVYDLKGFPLLINDTFRSLLGWEESAYQLNASIFDLELFADIAIQVLDLQSIIDSPAELVLPDGTTRHLTISGVPLRRDDALLGIIITLHDVTHARETEAAEREQRILAEALRETASLLTRSLDPEGIFTQLLDNVGRVIPHDSANVMLIEGDNLRAAYTRGYPADEEGELRATIFPIAEFPTFSQAISNNHTVSVENTRAFADWKSVPGTQKIGSFITVPLRAYGRIVGLLNLDSLRPYAFTSQHIERLRAFADQAAIALENAQLYDAIYRDAAKLRTLNRATSTLLTTSLAGVNNPDELYTHIAQIIVQEFHDVDCGIMLVEPHPEGLDINPMSRAGSFQTAFNRRMSSKGLGLIPHAIRSGRTVLAPDVSHEPLYLNADPRTKSELVVPLRGSQGIIGAIDLQSQTLNAFAQEDARILEAFAERAAAIIENLRLYQDIQRRVDERTTELNRVKDRAEAILNHSSDAIMLIRSDGRIQQTNQAFNIAFGFEPDEAFNKSFEAIAGPYFAEILRQALDTVVETVQPARLEIIADRSDGSDFDADVVISPILQQERVYSVVCSLRDISSRKRLERDLREALSRERELNELKTQFISRASHEFRTPLMMISMATDLLRAYNEQNASEKRSEKLDSIQQQVHHITLMLDELLTLSRAQELGNADLQWTDVELLTLCESVINELQGGIGASHQFEFYSSGHDFNLTADPRWLRRALVNLISNAIKYSENGSLIQINLTQTDSQLFIRVQDEGLGIPDDDQIRLFEPFHRASNVEHINGTGLGLSIVKQAAELHGGSISVQSKLGIGSAFTIILPYQLMREHS